MINQLILDESTQELWACWSTNKGIYKVNRLPFGVKPAVSIFQKTVEKVLQDVKGACNYLDDIVVTGKTFEEHLSNLETVFKKLQDAGFTLNIKKCQFFQSEISHLGHKINSYGVQKDAKRVAAINSVPQPKNCTELKAFIGMINYYGKFVPNLSTILSPLYALLKKNVNFFLSEQCENQWGRFKKN